MNKDQWQCEFAVGLTREEYIRFQALLSKNGRKAGIAGIALAVFMVLMGVVTLVMDYRITGQWDVSLTVMLLLIVLVEGLFLWQMPHQQRARSGDAYDTTRFSGYSFDGVVTVEQDRICKKTAQSTTEILWDRCAYLESEDLMIFGGGEKRAIVIPSRCLTAEDAERVRAAALSSVPAMRRRLFAKLVPLATERLPMPSFEQPEDATLMTVAVHYTKKEFYALADDAFFHKLPASLPSKALLSLFIALLCFSMNPSSALPVFLLSVLVLSVLSYLFNRIHIRQALVATQDEVLSLKVLLTEQTVTIQGIRATAKQLTVPWNCLSRAVEYPQTVELYTQDVLLTIPKRCIEDWEAFRHLVDEKLQKNT